MSLATGPRPRPAWHGSPGAFLALGLALTSASAQAGADIGYREPPAAIREILDAPATPGVLLAPGGRMMVLLERHDMPTIAELAEPEMALAGVRFNPQTNGPSAGRSITGLTFQDIASGQRRAAHLPSGARVGFLLWSPDGTQMAFANTVAEGVELWVANARTGATRRLMGPVVNAALGPAFAWMPDGRALVVRRVPPDRGEPPAGPRVPTGPLIQQTDERAMAVRTFPDLLASPHDEAAFDYYLTSQLVLQPVDGDQATTLGAPGIVASFSIAPDGRHVLVTRVQRPYSYAMTMSSFGRVTEVIDLDGRPVYRVHDRRELLIPRSGRDMVTAGPRHVHWRADAPATLVWATAADGGHARDDADVHDRVLMLDAPFSGPPRTLLDRADRFSGIYWARDDLAIVQFRSSRHTRSRTWIVDPSRPGAQPRLLWERSTEDRYGDPGRPATTTNEAGQTVLRLAPDGDAFYLTGAGASQSGNYPFLDRADLATGRIERLWQAEDPHYESTVAVLDDRADRFITRRESRDDPPNYFLRDRPNGTIEALTRFADPAPQLAGIGRQLITYPRDDGVTLSATLFTPPNYDPRRDGPLPLLVWAYPREFRDADAASQVSGSDHRFSRPSGLSHLFLLTQGYAVLDGPAMPIIGPHGAEPNDTYVEQLTSSARAAVDAVVGMGVADPDRIAVGGHSYGAFMTANLLAHTDLFRAGIALSGAYNRTLTPFGFQSERRSYWQAKAVYDRMSAFAYADRITQPLLLVHGEADDNPGTFPLQSERMYHALAGHGAPARFVSLPHEGHSYTARESVLHVLAEMVDWLEVHLKPNR